MDRNYKKITFESAKIPEWDVLGVLGESIAPADDAESRLMLDSLRIALPDEIRWTALREHAEHCGIHLELPSDQADKDFYLAEVPLSIIQPRKYSLVRLALELNLETDQTEGDVVAYDVFPKNTLNVKQIASGEAKVDISKALKFVPGLGETLSKCLELKLSVPFTWKSSALVVQAAGVMSQKAKWLVTDSGMPDGTFSGSLIIRLAKGVRPAMDAELACELRHKGLSGIIYGRFRTPPISKHHYSYGET